MSNGFYLQKRVGQHGKLFTIVKLKTMHPITQKIHPIQAFFRKYKIDEIPQLINVLIGNMSIVGPRPDVSGYYDLLVGDERKILLLKPGLTSEASLYFFDEEKILLKQVDPKKYNDSIIFAEKVKLNLLYANNHNFIIDLKIIFKTIKRIFIH
jgi:lipopolysaccharide/colanic/teichoic acid biosynthesis glycosyltransferase